MAEGQLPPVELGIGRRYYGDTSYILSEMNRQEMNGRAINSFVSQIKHAANDAVGNQPYSFYDNASPLEKVAIIGTYTTGVMAGMIAAPAIASAIGVVGTAMMLGPVAEGIVLEALAPQALLQISGTMASAGIIGKLGLFGNRGGESSLLRQRVLGNIAESKAARGGASYFKIHTYVEDALTINVDSDLNAAIFWSGKGNRALAENYALKTGGTTLEMTEGGKWLNSQELFKNYPYEKALRPWEVLSERFAQNASGRIAAFVENSSQRSIFSRIENPVLQTNPNITEILYSPEIEYAKRFGR